MHITFVSPRYGASILGGAEMAIRMLATKLAAAGHRIDVHSTTATSMATWADELPAASTTEDGVTVHRHRTAAKRHRRFDSISAKVLADPAAASAADEQRWIKAQGPHSPDLIGAISEVTSDVIVFSPYLYEPCLIGVPLARVPTVMHPASHDEAPLRLPAVRRAVESIDGLAFYTDAERRLTEQVIPPARSKPQMLVGLGVDQPTEDTPADSRIAATRAALGLGDQPYFLVLGRVDPGKGTHALVEMFGELFSSGRISARLVVAGPIVSETPVAPGVTVVGPVDDVTKQGLLAGASALINPSVMESFSLVVLESWMAGTPVIVNAGCAATVEHARRSGGGLAYSGVEQLGLALSAITRYPDRAALLAQNGRAYVDSWYTWPAIITRYVPFLHQVIQHAAPTPGAA